MTVKRFVLLVTTVLLTVSCSSKKEANEFIDSALGSWRTGCENFGLDSSYGQATITVEEDTFEFTNNFYVDPRCTSSSIRFSTIGTLTKHDSLIRDQEFLQAEIDFLLEQLTVVLLDQAKVDEFNGNATCGRTDWTQDVSVDVSNCVDIVGSNVPRTEYDVYTTDSEVDNEGQRKNVLYTGLLRGNTEATRPATPDFQNPYWQLSPE